MALKVLLADDNITAQRMGSKILSEAGYTVVAVSNGAAAVKKIASEKPDFAILDIFMPGYTGLEVCEKVKSSSETSRMLVLLTVTSMEPYSPADGYRVKADGVLIKPFEATDLLSVLHKFEDKLQAKTLGPKAKPEPEPVSEPEAAPEEMEIKRETLPQDVASEPVLGLEHLDTPAESAPTFAVQAAVASVMDAAPSVVGTSVMAPEALASFGETAPPAVPELPGPVVDEVPSTEPLEQPVVAEPMLEAAPEVNVGPEAQVETVAEPPVESMAAFTPQAEPPVEISAAAEVEVGAYPAAHEPLAEPPSIFESPATPELAPVEETAASVEVAAVQEPAPLEEPAPAVEAWSEVEPEAVAESALPEQVEPSGNVPVLEPLPELEYTSALASTPVEVAPPPELEPTAQQMSEEPALVHDPALATDPSDYVQFATRFGMEHPDEIPVGIALENPPEEPFEAMPEAVAEVMFTSPEASIAELAEPETQHVYQDHGEPATVREPMLEPEPEPEPEYDTQHLRTAWEEPDDAEFGAMLQSSPQFKEMAAAIEPERQVVTAEAPQESEAAETQPAIDASMVQQAIAAQLAEHLAPAETMPEPAMAVEHDMEPPAAAATAANTDDQRVAQAVQRVLDRYKGQLIDAIVRELKS